MNPQIELKKIAENWHNLKPDSDTPVIMQNLTLSQAIGEWCGHDCCVHDDGAVWFCGYGDYRGGWASPHTLTTIVEWLKLNYS